MLLVPCLDHPLLGHCTQPSATADLVATSSHLYPSLEDSASPDRSPRPGDDREAVTDSPPRGVARYPTVEIIDVNDGGYKTQPFVSGQHKVYSAGHPRALCGIHRGWACLNPYLFLSYAAPLPCSQGSPESTSSSIHLRRSLHVRLCVWGT